MYKPKPVCTDNIKLPEELYELVEKIAENVHENWAFSRMEEGWIYGDKRDDDQKTTPCMIPYENLPETEKEYDRKTAIETLKFIISMGYTINKS